MAPTHTRTLMHWHLLFVAALVIALAVAVPGRASADNTAVLQKTPPRDYTTPTPPPPVYPPYQTSVNLNDRAALTICGTVIPALSNLRVDVTETTATIQFDTCATMKATAILYADVNPAPFGNGQVIDATAATHHQFRFANLPAGAGYRYRLVEMNAGDLQEGRFQTTYPTVTSVTIVESDARALEMSFTVSNGSSISVVLTALGPPDEDIVQPVTVTFDGINDRFWFRQPGLRAHSQYFWAIQSNGKTIKGGMFNT